MSLIKAVLEGNLAEVQKLLKEDPESFHETNEDDQTALICLCANRDLKKDAKKYKEYIEIFTLLLEQAKKENVRKDLNIINWVDLSGNGLTACMYAMENQNEEFIKGFIENIDLLDLSVLGGGRTPLIMATRTGCTAMVTALIKKHASETTDESERIAFLETTDQLKRTALHWAAFSTHKDIDGKDITHEEIVKILLDHKANTKATDRFGKDPLALATEKGHSEVVKLLKPIEANLEMTEQKKSSKPKM